MSNFARRIDHIDKLEHLSMSAGPNWWKDLLHQWRPSGNPAGEFGLRLAIRDNSINFYRKGQSVARVHFNGNGQPRASVHLKYLNCEGLCDDRPYACIENGKFTLRGKELPRHAQISFREITTASEAWAGGEKHFVDLAVEDNPAVVDLEIGLPRIARDGGAPRMDLAVLEKGTDSSQLRLVFWEAKTVDDARLRSSRPENVKVRGQLDRYEDFMKDSVRHRNVGVQYQNACNLLARLARMAQHCGNDLVLDRRITDLAESKVELTVDPVARLVIFEGETIVKGRWESVTRVSTWDHHQAVLTDRLKIELFGPLIARPYNLALL